LIGGAVYRDDIFTTVVSIKYANAYLEALMWWLAEDGARLMRDRGLK
jgi:hypothetical protein